MPLSRKQVKYVSRTYRRSTSEWAHEQAAKHSAFIYSDILGEHAHLEIAAVDDEPDLWMVTFHGWTLDHEFRPTTLMLTTYMMKAIFAPVVEQIDAIIEHSAGMEQIPVISDGD